MLTELAIKNYALIENLRLEFSLGLNVFTGETGAGKSIIIDAIGLLLGEKCTVSVVKPGAEKCSLSAAFDLRKNNPAKKYLQEFSLTNEDDPNSLTLRREIDAQNKSRIFINDQPVSLSALSGLGDFLIDIHGQHEHQQLLKTSRQMDLLDRYADHPDLLEKVATLFAQWKILKTDLENSQISDQDKEQKMDLFRFQVNEIEAAALHPDEESRLEQSLPQMKNAEKLRAFSEELYAQLYAADGSALERLKKSKNLLASIQTLGVELQDPPRQLEEAILQASEVSEWVMSFKDKLNVDPKKLDEVLSRQDLIHRLKKKYGASVPEILAHMQKVKQELAHLEQHSESLAELKEQIAQAEKSLLQACKKLSASRQKAGEKFSVAVQKELKDLGFPKAEFVTQLQIELSEGQPAPTAHGLEKVEFLFSANPGLAAQPLRQVASGGELSRIMLALKKILADSDPVPTLIFDEVDAGIGGTIGNVIGGKLKELSRFHQTILITHLPQIAVFGQRHISVRKTIQGKSTAVLIETVSQEKRVKEIARMLGGSQKLNEDPSAISIQHASELLAQVK